MVFSSSAHIIGVSVKETIADTKIVTLSVTANSRKSLPMTSPINSSGINTATSETLKDTMVKPISDAPLRDAGSGSMPSSTYRMMFSIMTIASSTTNPVEIVSAMRVRLLSV